MSSIILGVGSQIMVLAIILSIVLLFLGVGLLVLIRICIVGRTFRREFDSMVSVERRNTEAGIGLSTKDLEKLPCYIFKAGEKGSGAMDCAVCLESFQLGDSRTATAPVVGWPPIRSFRKNIASNSSKPSLESQNEEGEANAKLNCRKSLLVKINMDGIPIGRKVDLMVYGSYEKLPLAVEELFRGLLEAQKDPSVVESQNHGEEDQIFSGLLDGTGKYTLVYEDNDGDRMLVGDVPWDMFLATARRLRVLKTSEISGLLLAGGKKTSRC